MSIEIRIPAIGFSTQEGTLSAWLVEDGATVQAGQAIFSLELDKSIQEIESPASGRLKIIGEAGKDYAVGALVAEIT